MPVYIFLDFFFNTLKNLVYVCSNAMQVTSQLTLKIACATEHSAVLLSFSIGLLAAVNQAASHKGIKPVLNISNTLILILV